MFTSKSGVKLSNEWASKLKGMLICKVVKKDSVELGNSGWYLPEGQIFWVYSGKIVNDRLVIWMPQNKEHFDGVIDYKRHVKEGNIKGIGRD